LTNSIAVFGACPILAEIPSKSFLAEAFSTVEVTYTMTIAIILTLYILASIATVRFMALAFTVCETNSFIAAI